MIHKICDDLYQGKEAEENKGHEVTVLTWIIMVSLDVTFPQVDFIFLSLIEPYC